MKKLILVTVAILLIIPSVVLAKEIVQNIVVDKDEIINSNFIRAARTIDISGQVNGDVIVAANEINISGQVAGDVIAAGNIIKITGSVEGNVRVAGNHITIDGIIGKNLNAFGATVDLDKDAQVAWSALLFGADVNIRGFIGGHLDGGAANFDIYGQIGADSTVYLSKEGKLTVYDGSEINGKLTYRGESTDQAIFKSGAIVTEKQFVKQEMPQLNWKSILGWGGGFIIFAKLVKLFGLFIVGLILIALFHKKLFVLTDSMWKKSGKLMGWGLVYLIVIPIILFLLFITIIGIPLAVIAGMFYGIALYLTKILVGLLIGKKILERLNKGKEVSLTWSLVLGVLVYVAIVSIPWIGFFIGLVGMVWALGALGELLKKVNWKEVKKA